MITLLSPFLKFREPLTKRIIIKLIMLRFSRLKGIIITFIETTSLVSKCSKHIIFFCTFSLTYVKRIEVERIFSFSFLNGIGGFMLKSCIKRVELIRIWVLRKETVFLLKSKVRIFLSKRLLEAWSFLFELILSFFPTIQIPRSNLLSSFSKSLL